MLSTIILSGVILAGFLILFYLISQRIKQSEERQKSDQSLILLNQNIQGMQGRLDDTTKAINERLDRAAQVISEVTHELGGVKEIGHQIQSFQDFLKSPKLRGNIGEQVLQDLLEQFFSKDHFVMQYKFRSGQIVDAILKTNDGIIPIDAKFPLESFQRYLSSKDEEEQTKIFKECIKAVKTKIDEISNKYILPEEGTVDFAVMYIPSEVIYYELVSKSDFDLDNYAKQKKVYFVSPNTFYYFIKIIMVGMKGQQLQEEAKKIIRILQAVEHDTQKLGEILGVATGHIANAKNALDKVNNEYTKLYGHVEQTKLLK